MKKIVVAFMCMAIWSPVFAFDTWAETKYESGESIFMTEPMPSLIIGQNGLGLTYINFFLERILFPKKPFLLLMVKTILWNSPQLPHFFWFSKMALHSLQQLPMQKKSA